MSRTLRIALLALAMILVIVGMIVTYGRDLRSGAEITLKTEPVDPRSLFLGHYATLGYAINRLDETIVGDHCYKRNENIFVTLEPDDTGEWRAVRAGPAMPADGFAENRVTLRGRPQWETCPETPDKAAAAPEPAPERTTAAEEPAAEPAGEEEGVEAAPIADADAIETPFVPTIWVSYGIEQYYASPEAAQRLQDLALRRSPPAEDGSEAESAPEPLEIILSVPRSGRALIKGVVIDGVKTYDQTLY